MFWWPRLVVAEDGVFKYTFVCVCVLSLYQKCILSFMNDYEKVIVLEVFFLAVTLHEVFGYQVWLFWLTEAFF